MVLYMAMTFHGFSPDVYVLIILTLVRKVVASGYSFLPSYSKGELWNGTSMARVHIATPTGNIPETSEVRTPVYSGHFRWHQWCPQHFVLYNAVSTIENVR